MSSPESELHGAVFDVLRHPLVSAEDDLVDPPQRASASGFPVANQSSTSFNCFRTTSVGM